MNRRNALRNPPLGRATFLIILTALFSGHLPATSTGELRAMLAQRNDGTVFHYDPSGNLRRVNLPDGTVVEYVVDGANRRIAKLVNGRRTQAFLYEDTLHPVAELDAENRVVSRFIYAGGNAPDVMIRDGREYRVITDELGSVRLVVDASAGTIAQQMDYDEFGNVLNDTNPGFQPFGFAGGLFDGTTNLVRFGARDYDPLVGRWTAKDPRGFADGETNAYAYVLNDPLNFVDPSGRQTAGGTSLGGWPTPQENLETAVNLPPRPTRPLENYWNPTYSLDARANVDHYYRWHPGTSVYEWTRSGPLRPGDVFRGGFYFRFPFLDRDNPPNRDDAFPGADQNPFRIPNAPGTVGVSCEINWYEFWPSGLFQ